MKEKYNELFRIYLHVVSADRDAIKGEDELRKRIEEAERFRLKLLGMVILLRECGLFSIEEEAVETNRIMESFSIVTLFNAILKPSDVYVFREVNE